jgi:multicomponent Na+:H+ antiporter subunit G
MTLAIIGIAFMALGLVFFLGCVVGLIRFPDFYTRMHAAGKGDTLSSALLLIGFACFALHSGVNAGTVLVALKILGISMFIMLTSPASTHALMRSGYEDGIKPYEGPDAETRDKEETA